MGHALSAILTGCVFLLSLAPVAPTTPAESPPPRRVVSPLTSEALERHLEWAGVTPVNRAAILAEHQNYIGRFRDLSADQLAVWNAALSATPSTAAEAEQLARLARSALTSSEVAEQPLMTMLHSQVTHSDSAAASSSAECAASTLALRRCLAMLGDEQRVAWLNAVVIPAEARMSLAPHLRAWAAAVEQECVAAAATPTVRFEARQAEHAHDDPTIDPGDQDPEELDEQFLELTRRRAAAIGPSGGPTHAAAIKSLSHECAVIDAVCASVPPNAQLALLDGWSRRADIPSACHPHRLSATVASNPEAADSPEVAAILTDWAAQWWPLARAYASTSLEGTTQDAEADPRAGLRSQMRDITARASVALSALAGVAVRQPTDAPARDASTLKSSALDPSLVSAADQANMLAPTIHPAWPEPLGWDETLAFYEALGVSEPMLSVGAVIHDDLAESLRPLRAQWRGAVDQYQWDTASRLESQALDMIGEQLGTLHGAMLAPTDIGLAQWVCRWAAVRHALASLPATRSGSRSGADPALMALLATPSREEWMALAPLLMEQCEQLTRHAAEARDRGAAAHRARVAAAAARDTGASTEDRATLNAEAAAALMAHAASERALGEAFTDAVARLTRVPDAALAARLDAAAADALHRRDLRDPTALHTTFLSALAPTREPAIAPARLDRVRSLQREWETAWRDLQARLLEACRESAPNPQFILALRFERSELNARALTQLRQVLSESATP